MATTPIGDAVRLANTWMPGCGRWKEFDPPPGCDQRERWIWDGCRLLSIAIESGDAVKIAYERASLSHACQQYIDSRGGGGNGNEVPPSEDGGGFFRQLMVCLMAVVAGLVLGRLLRTDMGHYVVKSTVRGLIYRGIGALRT